jgi:hypothetical protein
VNDFVLPLSDQAHNVSIVGKDVSLRAGSQHEFSCVAFGSRPAATLTWWFDQTIVKQGMDGVHVVRNVIRITCV